MFFFILNVNLMVSVHASSTVGCGFEPDRVKSRTIKLVFVSTPLSTQNSGERAKTGGSESELCVRVGRHVYSGTVVSVS
jgi:hypothetical protein